MKNQNQKLKTKIEIGRGGEGGGRALAGRERVLINPREETKEKDKIITEKKCSGENRLEGYSQWH